MEPEVGLDTKTKPARASPGQVGGEVDYYILLTGGDLEALNPWLRGNRKQDCGAVEEDGNCCIGRAPVMGCGKQGLQREGR